jgi:predicted RNA-binding protein with PUA-like domain
LKSDTYKDIKDVTWVDGDEIVFENERSFVGSLSYYDPSDCEEVTIQNAMHRFNTVQREMRVGEFEFFYYNDFEDIQIDRDVDINPNGRFGHQRTDDSVTVGGSRSGTGHGTFGNGLGGRRTPVNHGTRVASEDKLSKKYRMPEDTSEKLYYPEGYYYQSSYRIPIRNYSSSITSVNPDMFEIMSIKVGRNEWRNVPSYTINTVEANYLSNGDKLYIYNAESNECYTLVVTSVTTSTKFDALACNSDGSYRSENIGYEETDESNNINSFKLFKRPYDASSYASVILDGSCRFYWRELEPIDDYPFTNGAFYIKKDVNFYLRRQDPFGENLSVQFVGPDYIPVGENVVYYQDIEDYSEEVEEC